MASLNLFKAFPNELLQTEVRRATMLPLRKTDASAVKRDAVFSKHGISAQVTEDIGLNFPAKESPKRAAFCLECTKYSVRRGKGKARMPNSPKLPTDKRLRVRRSEAPEYLGISQRQLDYRIASKEIRTVRDGDAVFITMAELRRYATTNHPPIRNKARKSGVAP